MRRHELIDLGHDRTRMKDPRDVERQHRTVQVLLDRFYATHDDERFELQVLADEVGMGKTFVALAVALSILEARRNKAPELGRCAKKILVLVPSNAALFYKWQREVGEFVKRCLPSDKRLEVARWFYAQTVWNPDDLVSALTQRRSGSVVIAKPSALRGRVQHLDAKAQLVLRVLFTHWSTAFKKDMRRRLLAGAPGGWPTTLDELDAAVRKEDQPFAAGVVREALTKYIARPEAVDMVEELRQFALAAAGEHFLVRRRERMQALRRGLARLYKHALLRESLSRALPLVIVDEAHNWKNHKHGYDEFVRFIAPHTQRLLLMTATPFQLRPDEMLKILEAGDDLKLPKERRERIRSIREKHLSTALNSSERASQALSREWARLNGRVTQAELTWAWQLPCVREVIPVLQAMADSPGALDGSDVEATVDRGITECPPALQAFLKQALMLYAHNRDLSRELGEWVIRHRKPNDHRLVRVGRELEGDEHELAAQPGCHILHAAPGLDVRGEAELPHYLLMRATAQMSQGKGRASLGCNLTGCYSTLFESCDGRALQKVVSDSQAKLYIDLLRELVADKAADAQHPKMRAVVQRVVEHWEAGDKSLLFCFRTKTAERLHDLVRTAIDERLKSREQRCLGGPGQLERLRDRLTGRDRDLMPVALDRVLWSLHWAPPLGEEKHAIHTEGFNVQAGDYREIARLSLKFGVDLRADRLDRVFLHRAAECAMARRLRAQFARDTKTRIVLEAIADEHWVHFPYGIEAPTEDEGEPVIDEKGVHHVYDQSGEPSASEADALKDYLLKRDATARRERRTPPVRNAFDGPSLWLGADPRHVVIAGHDLPVDLELDLRAQRQFHLHLRSLTWNGDELDWTTRALAMQAVRRVALRTSMLVRLLPTDQAPQAQLSAEALVNQFTKPLGGKGESLLRRLGVFLEDLASASGDIGDPTSARGALLDTTRIKSSVVVGRVTGGTDAGTRNRYFNGFNTPLEPEVLICTSVGQEGIDLHRHCRHVYHYDLAWNPAALEQRTGRIDRIGCLAQRERQLEARAASNGNGARVPRSLHYLDISVPYLAGTYDERMYEELRLRSQVFEVLTGGELAPDASNGKPDDDEPGAEDEGSVKAEGLVVLPEAMIDELRVDLRVWPSRGAAVSSSAGSNPVEP